MDTGEQVPGLSERIAGYPLIQALLGRRSRRFAAGMAIGGPLAYVRNGDRIRLSVKAREISLLVSDAATSDSARLRITYNFRSSASSLIPDAPRTKSCSI